MSCLPDGMERPVTRTEIADHLTDAFAPGPATRAHLVGVATRAGAREQLLIVLQTLSDGPYHRLQELWGDLAHLPVEA